MNQPDTRGWGIDQRVSIPVCASRKRRCDHRGGTRSGGADEDYDGDGIRARMQWWERPRLQIAVFQPPPATSAGHHENYGQRLNAAKPQPKERGQLCPRVPIPMPASGGQGCPHSLKIFAGGDDVWRQHCKAKNLWQRFKRCLRIDTSYARCDLYQLSPARLAASQNWRNRRIYRYAVRNSGF